MKKVTEYLVGQSPILTHNKVESTCYALRLTPLDKYGVEEIDKFLQGNSSDWIHSLELSKGGKPHYHIVMWSDKDEETVRQSIRDFLLPFFPKPKRGDANKQYNLSEVQDIEMSITYILKDGGELKYSKGINETELEKYKKQSYKKYSKQEFASKLEELKKQFKAGDLDIREMMEKVVLLKSVYRQPINMQHIYQMCLSFEIHNKPRMAACYVQDFLSRYK